MKKRTISLIIAALIISAAMFVARLSAAAEEGGNTFADLGLSTSEADLANHDVRAANQPFGSKNFALRPLLEKYLVTIQKDAEGNTYLKRKLEDDNTRGTVESGAIPVGYKYVKALAVDAWDEGREQSVAELYYEEEAVTVPGEGGAPDTTTYNWALKLSLVDARGDLDQTSVPLTVLAETGAANPLITRYYNEHTLMGMTAGDYDNDGYSELVVYIADAADPRLALYEIMDGQIAATPSQTFSFTSRGYGLSKYVYLTSGDITGDNVDDLVFCYTGPEQKTHTYIFKSQDFSLGSPHVFHRGEASAQAYYEWQGNAAAAIGNFVGSPDDKVTELVLGRCEQETRYSVNALRYIYDPVKKSWDFKSVFSQSKGPSELMPISDSISDLTSVVFQDRSFFNEKHLGDLYINGVLYFYEFSTDTDQFCFSADYGVISGYFGSDASGQERLGALREKFYWDGSVGEFISAGLEIYTTPAAVPLDPSVACAAFAAPNTDDDTMIYRYIGYELQYADPKILAVLASPPYFEDLEHLDGGEFYVGCSSTEFSSGEGSGSGYNTNISLTAGAYVSFEHKVSFFGLFELETGEVEVEMAYHYTWDQEHTMEISKEVTYGTFGGQDSVAVYTIPYDTYTYEVWVPGEGGTPGAWQTMQSRFPYEPVYSIVSLEQYDEAARRYGLLVLGDRIITHTVGRPETYPGSDAELYGAKNVIKNGDQFIGVGFGDSVTSQTIEIDTSTTTTVTQGASVDFRVGAGGGGLVIGVVGGLESGIGKSQSKLENVAFTGTVMSMPAEAQSLGYGYDWQLVEYTYEATEEDFGLQKHNFSQQSFPVLQYVVKNVRRPPLLPKDFRASSVTANSVTLSWENIDPNTTGYQLYRYYDFGGGLAGYKKIGPVLSAGTTSYTDTGLMPYMTYKYRIESIGQLMGGGAPVPMPSVQSPELIVHTMTDSDVPAIVTQPVSVTVAAGGTANFQVIAEPAASASPNERLFYTWQKLTGGIWRAVSGGTEATLHILDAREEHAGRYRCALSQLVGERAVTVYSREVTLTIDKNSAALSLTDNTPSPVISIDQDITLTASFSGTQATKPTGHVLFYITHYPDPATNPQYDPDDPGTGSPFIYAGSSETAIAAPLTGGTQAQISWSPKGYGSYEIVAVYNGDELYYGSVSGTRSLACAPSGSNFYTALHLTGLEEPLTYGDTRTLGASVAQNGAVKSLTASEIRLSVTTAAGEPTDGLLLVNTGGANPAWQLLAKKAGSYTLTAECDTAAASGKLRITQNVIVSRAQIAVKAKDQQRQVNTENAPFELELTSGTLKLSDTLTGTFDTDFGCTAVTDSPPGVYDIFINSFKEKGTENYSIIAAAKGRLTVSGMQYNIKFRGVSNGRVTALIDNWDLKEQNFTTGYDLDYGTVVRFTAIPDTGYKIQKWVVNGIEMMKESGSSEFDTSPYVTVGSLDRNLTIEVYFTLGMCEVSYAAGEHGTLSAKVGGTDLGNGAYIASGTAVTFTAVPDEGYMVSGWKVNGVMVEGQAGTTYTLTVTGDTSVEVLFTLAEDITVSYKATGSGTVTAQTAAGAEIKNSGKIVKGTTVIFTAAPADANAMIKEWIVNGQVVQGNSSTYTVENVQADLDVEVVFAAAILYKVNYSAIGYGASYLTASVNGVPISSGDLVQGYSQVVFTAHPPQGYKVKQWKLGTATVPGENGLPLQDVQYTLARLSSSVTVTVEFEAIPMIGSNVALSDLTVDGNTVSNFNPNTYHYTVALPHGSVLPAVGATPADPTATVRITQAVDLPGSATVEVTAGDGTRQTYTIIFTLGTPATCTVTFNSDGTVYAAITVQAGLSIGTANWPANPVKTGSTFNGWYTGANGSGSVLTPATPINASMIVYAKWTTTSGSPGDGGGSGEGSGSTTELTPSQINNLLSGNQPLNLEYDQLQINIAPSALSSLISSPEGGEGGGNIQIQASLVTDPDTLNTFFIRYPGRQGIMKGYNINLSRKTNGRIENITELNGEITLTFEFTPEELAGLDPGSLVVYKRAEDGSITELRGKFDWETNSLSVTTGHLCDFYIMGQRGIPTQRLAGENRYATAAAVSAWGWERSDNVLLVSGENFPDALAGAALARALDAPVLLTSRENLNSETLAEIRRLNAKNIYILGGTGAVSPKVEEILVKDYTVTRISGASRYETAVKIGQAVLKARSGGLTPDSTSFADTVVLATGTNYPDALSVAPFAGQYGLPVLFTERDSLNNVTKQALQEWGIKQVIICGGCGAVSEQVESFLKEEMELTVTRLSGTDRYLTGLAITGYFAARQNGAAISRYAALATGENFPDALAGAALAAKLHMPVLLTGKDQLNPAIRDYLKGLELERIYIFGGQGAVGDKVKEGF